MTTVRGVTGRRVRSARAAAALVVLLVVAGCSGGGDGSGGVAPDVAPPAVTKVPAEPAAPPADAGSAPPVELDAEVIARTYGDAVWQVLVEGCDAESSGSSFAIAPDLFVTNRHVVETDATPMLRSRDGATKLDATVIGMSDEVDLALLRVDGAGGAVDVVLEWADTASLSEGQQVIALGYPAPFETFSVAVGTLNAFDVVDGVRVGIISDEASDYGSSGGPLVTSSGQVAGIVTEFAGEGGRQVLGVSLTHDAVRDEIARILAAPAVPEIDCDDIGLGGFGDDEVLDALQVLCGDGEMWACDELHRRTDGIGAYGGFGATCGDLVDTDEWCTELYGEPEAFTYGDVASLDALWDGCEAGAGGAGSWAADCDLLFSLAPIDSDYEAFGDSCGTRNEPSGWCEDLYG